MAISPYHISSLLDKVQKTHAFRRDFLKLYVVCLLIRTPEQDVLISGVS